MCKYFSFSLVKVLRHGSKDVVKNVANPVDSMFSLLCYFCGLYCQYLLQKRGHLEGVLRRPRGCSMLISNGLALRTAVFSVQPPVLKQGKQKECLSP